MAARTAALHSGDRDRVKAALREGLVTPALVAQAILLLGWDEVAPEALEALRRVAGSVFGQLTDALVDPATEFSIRRRVPRALPGSRTRASRCATSAAGRWPASATRIRAVRFRRSVPWPR